MYFSFPLLRKKQLRISTYREERCLCFEGHFQRIRSLVNWLCCFWVCDWTAHHGGESNVEHNCSLLADQKQEGEWENRWGISIAFKNMYPMTSHLAPLPESSTNSRQHQMPSNKPWSHDLSRHLIFKQRQVIAPQLWHLCARVYATTSRSLVSEPSPQSLQ